jgi:hypothetical protein
MNLNAEDLLVDHLAALEGVDPPALDPVFFDRLKERMHRDAMKRARQTLRHAGLATGILVLLLMLNLRWLTRNPSRDTTREPTGISGFASFYDQSISSDL